MFNLSANDTCAGENTEQFKRDKKRAMNSLKNNLTNCPVLIEGMSHEMRTHMNAVVAFSFLMKENDCNNSEREEFSNQILNSCEQLIGLFDSFLDSALIDMGNSKSDSKICKLNNFLDDLLDEFRGIIEKEGHKNVELITDIKFSDSDEISIDSNRISRVISSLFQNSIKTTKSGYIKIGYFLEDDKLTFYVKDSGHSYFKCKEFLFSEDLNESLLKHNDTYAAINITLAKKLIKMMGGSIRIERNGATGCGIYFSVPAKMIVTSDTKNHKYANNMIAI